MTVEEINQTKWVVRLDSWAGITEHPVKVLKLGPSRSRVEFLADNPKGMKGARRTVPTGALKTI